ncbi:MAG: hypothetical protein V1888_02165 [archaeon]
MVMKSFILVVGTLLILSFATLFGLYFYEDSNIVDLLSGNAIRDSAIKFYESSTTDNKILVLIELVIGFSGIAFIYWIVRRLRRKNLFFKYGIIKEKVRKSLTDLDTLYEILKERKSIGIADIEKLFNVNSEVALGWAKILENGDLAIIDYPSFGKPVLMLVEENVKGGNTVDKRPEEKKIASSEKKTNVYQLMRPKLRSTKTEKVDKKIIKNKTIVKKAGKK